jgi:DNA-binding NtrC family response regulator
VYKVETENDMAWTPGVAPRFDAEAQRYVDSLFRTCAPERFLEVLSGYAPATREERAAHAKFRGWALYDAGEYRRARPHLLRALRLSMPRSADRAIVYGVLGETFLRTGKLGTAELCAHRGLLQCPDEDPGNYLRAGHLHMLGRVSALRGRLVRAIAEYRRGLALVDAASPQRMPLTTNLANALLHVGRPQEGQAVLDELRASMGGGTQQRQAWALAASEAWVALGMGDAARAERVLETAIAAEREPDRLRVRLGLMEQLSATRSALGQFESAEALALEVAAECVPEGRNSDLLASAERDLALALEGRAQFAQAARHAQSSIRHGRASDRLDWVAGLHLLGRCRHAMGEQAEARRAFLEALRLHAAMEFVTERKSLQRTLERLELTELDRLEQQTPPARRGARATPALGEPLSDGREFITLRRESIELVLSVAQSPLPALIEGETGTGKELIARLLHERGPRAKAPFVVVDCSSIPAELADVELFGAARGAYTGAVRERRGLVSQADGGTLFLDELPELPVRLQAKLLRLLQDGTFRRVGEDETRQVSIRCVAATNRPVEELVKRGELKLDLFHRLNGHRITLAPLRERTDEIEAIALGVLRRCGVGGLTPSSLVLLEKCPWPGNVRQLEMVLRLAAQGCALGGRLEPRHLLPHLPAPAAPERPAGLRSGRSVGEREQLERTLRESGGSVTQAARALGMSRQAIYKALRRSGL